MAEASLQEQLESARAAVAYNITMLAQLSEQVQEAREAHDRASSLVNDAQARVLSFNAVEQKVQQHRSALMEQWAKTGGEMPSLKPPKDLAAALEGRREAELVLEAAQAAQARMAEMLASAELAESGVREALDFCAIEVMKIQAEIIGTEIEARDLANAEDRQRLAAMWKMPLPNGARLAFGQETAVYKAVFRPRTLIQPETGFLPTANARAEQAKAWMAWREALKTDPQATFAPPPFPPGAVSERHQHLA